MTQHDPFRPVVSLQGHFGKGIGDIPTPLLMYNKRGYPHCTANYCTLILMYRPIGGSPPPVYIFGCLCYVRFLSLCYVRFVACVLCSFSLCYVSFLVCVLCSSRATARPSAADVRFAPVGLLFEPCRASVLVQNGPGVGPPP